MLDLGPLVTSVHRHTVVAAPQTKMHLYMWMVFSSTTLQIWSHSRRFCWIHEVIQYASQNDVEGLLLLRAQMTLFIKFCAQRLLLLRNRMSIVSTVLRSSLWNRSNCRIWSLQTHAQHSVTLMLQSRGIVRVEAPCIVLDIHCRTKWVTVTSLHDTAYFKNPFNVKVLNSLEI